MILNEPFSREQPTRNCFPIESCRVEALFRSLLLHPSTWPLSPPRLRHLPFSFFPWRRRHERTANLTSGALSLTAPLSAALINLPDVEFVTRAKTNEPTKERRRFDSSNFKTENCRGKTNNGTTATNQRRSIGPRWRLKRRCWSSLSVWKSSQSCCGRARPHLSALARSLLSRVICGLDDDDGDHDRRRRLFPRMSLRGLIHGKDKGKHATAHSPQPTGRPESEGVRQV